jgi:hypothetical protein
VLHTLAALIGLQELSDWHIQHSYQKQTDICQQLEMRHSTHTAMYIEEGDTDMRCAVTTWIS